MEYIWFMAAAILFLFIRFQIGERQRRKAWLERLEEQWGQVPDREYEPGELERISRYFQMSLEKEDTDNSCVIDDITWNDLGMDDIFMLLNHTQSSVGEEALYRQLRMPACEEAVLRERSRLAELFAGDASLRLELEKQLSGIGKRGKQALCDYIVNLSGQPCRSNGLHYLGMTMLAISAAMAVTVPNVGILMLAAVVAFQMITYYREKARAENYFSCVSKVVRLSVYGREICKMMEQESGAGLADYQAPLRNSIKELEPIRRKSRMIVMGNAMGGSPLDLAADYVKMLLHTDLIAYNQIVRLTKCREADIWKVVEILGQLECGLAVASFRECLGAWCLPEFQNGLFLHGDGLYHPLVDRAVPNTIHADRCQLITGSNASGKSTFLKTVAVNAVLAQTVCTVAGEAYQAPFYQIYSSMALTDNLVGGESYYMAEIRSLKRILDRGQDSRPVLCFIDEVLRGTNTVERIAASAQILKSMARMNLLCFAATHDGELTVLLEEWYDNGHFEDTVENGDVSFSYRLYPGRAVSRNALKLLDLMGYEPQVLKEAQDMAERFDRTGIWSMEHEG